MYGAYKCSDQRNISAVRSLHVIIPEFIHSEYSSDSP
jgi:hypothetical protein